VHILLIYPGGGQREGLLLAGTRERMRVMMPGQADIVEFRQIEGAWIAESGATVEIGAIGAAAHTTFPDSAALRVGPPRLCASASILQH